ncbi:hypothetical protein NMS_1527 [Nonlabens marinus S1-08]|uniref:Uncharacterized protein n=1 Tax=Nonlabens marinus S1-08 TaxID=1454201 RepID=W8W015_9FLAO|nr:hypothetical protein NMS_1527 [Nonlabens marinus S1-08]
MLLGSKNIRSFYAYCLVNDVDVSSLSRKRTRNQSAATKNARGKSSGVLIYLI